MGFFRDLRHSEYLEFLDQPWKPVPLWAMVAWLVAYAAFLLYAWSEHGVNLLQLFIPAALALSFFRMRQLPGTTFCWFMFFENFLGIATYMADARALDLPLVSAEGGDGEIGHDWNAIFSQLSLLPYDTRIAAVVRVLGWLGMLAVPLWFAWRARRSRLSS